ncbi:uncharacterized protein LOC105192274 [Harpegnathos saltator]|uniref:uncharacterized protein LOC105192274 n=1 Tax=Harpegnathos saltator TaxID=610380 RepID=UPI000DBEEAF8|nr:uncharacterized protein LOC105192274 [Harpegnathos saltator]
MERRFAHEPTFGRKYEDFMREYESLGHMGTALPLERQGHNKRCFLPHHGVFRESGGTKKLRVVFDGSHRTSDGYALNDFLRILLHSDDRGLQRILWCADGEVKAYRLHSVTYGLASAPFLAIRKLQQLATDEETRFPLGARVLREDVYMDNILTGAPSIPTALALRQQLENVCRAGGFPLRKWIANSEFIWAGIPFNYRADGEQFELLTREFSHASLGLMWRPLVNEFSFTIRSLGESAMTRRGVLSQAAQLFDPLGWMAPVTIRAKCLIKATWCLRISWGSPLPDEDVSAWRTFYEELPLLRQVSLPRWNGLDRPGSEAELHEFADASELAYAAMLYLRTALDNDVRVSLLCARTRVATLRQVSLPRLELCAATLLVRFASHAVSICKLRPFAVVGFNSGLKLDPKSPAELNHLRGQQSG